MRQGWPVARSGRKVGLLGGSFDPAHSGHVHITREALKRFGLDEVWWLVTPGNPLKTRGPAPLEARIARARGMMVHPRVRVTGLEARLGTRFTAETLAALHDRYPGVRFVWLMGADNLATFHLWERWRGILGQVPVGVIARPGRQSVACLGPAARAFAWARLPEHASHALAEAEPPAWCYVNVPLSRASSTAIRTRGREVAE